MNRRLERRVRQRADNRCEYCCIPQSAVLLIPHQIDHVIAEKHGGGTTMSNLAVACLACNRFKGPNIAGMDRESGRIVRLFHPRRDNWRKHFELQRHGRIIGLSAIGRATVEVLRLNEQRSVLLRQTLIAEGFLKTGKQR